MSIEKAPPAIDVLVAEHELSRLRLEVTASLLVQSISGGKQAAEAALGQVWSLLQFLEGGLETHIAKEEGALFPRLKTALPADDRLIDELVAEHDLVRMKRDAVRALLVQVLDNLGDLRLDRESLRAALMETMPPIRSLQRLENMVEIVIEKLRVHFANEEEFVFPLALTLLSSEELDQVASEMEALDDSAQAR
jgi:hemerythrin-like domain-containing protein